MKALLAAGLLLLPVTACTDDAPVHPRTPRAEPPTGPPLEELSTHGGQPCPRRLPYGGDLDQGFGPREPAEALPAVRVADRGWICRYRSRDAGRRPDGDMTIRWVRTRPEHLVDPAVLPELEDAVSQLVPPPPERFCTADLGPRWMLVLATAGDLTGIVVDDYGCREVRLTDDPFVTPPGEAEQEGLVAGVLDGSPELVEMFRAARS